MLLLNSNTLCKFQTIYTGYVELFKENHKIMNSENIQEGQNAFGSKLYSSLSYFRSYRKFFLFYMYTIFYCIFEFVAQFKRQIVCNVLQFFLGISTFGCHVYEEINDTRSTEMFELES